jgi:tetratricopeptide (TPR) repeat protein
VSERARKLRLHGLICLALGLVTLALYLPSLRHDFLAYDDQQYVTENPHVQAGLTGHGLVWAFGYHAGNWHPLTWLSHMLDCQLYGLKPAGHHLTNVLLHVANSVLLFLVLSRMTRTTWRSAFVAAIFAWHPLHVESVAWVAERKDVLSAFFWMLTLAAYAKHVASDKWQVTGKDAGFMSPVTCHLSPFYWLALLCFALALMSKPMAVTLPFVLLLLDYWPLRRLQPSTINHQPSIIRQLLLEKVPFFALTAVACALTVSAQRQAIVSTAGLPVSQRIAHALLSYVHYVGAMFVPHRLAVYYPYETAIPASQIIVAAILLALVTLVALRFATRRPYLLVGWLWYLGMLVPVIGLVQVGDQAWADRYTYLPLIGLFIVVAWGLGDLAVAFERRQAGCTVLRGVAVVVGLALLTGTSFQLRHWKNTRTLFDHAARVTRDNHMAVTMLGSLLAKDGKIDEAIKYYRTALQIKPGYPEAHFFLGNALDQQGKLDEAIADYRKALWFKPIQEQTHILLGVALAKQKKYDEATTHYLAALKLNPDSAVAHNNLARILHTQGRLDEAIEHYSAALKSDPNLAQAHNNLGILLVQKSRLADGTLQLREASRLNPGNPETQYNLALALNQQEQWSEAAALFAKTVGATSTDPNAHYQFAVALVHLQKPREAMSHYASALLIEPDFPDALDGLAWILATAANPEFRNGPEAVRMAERACELTGRKDLVKLKTLAAAYAETGRFPEAIDAAQSGLGVAAAAGRKEAGKDLETMLENFKAAKPWRTTMP